MELRPSPKQRKGLTCVGHEELRTTKGPEVSLWSEFGSLGWKLWWVGVRDDDNSEADDS